MLLLLSIVLALSAPRHASSQTGAHLQLNIPARRLEVWLDDSLVRTLDVAVGMRAWPTPVGGFAVTSVEWNPWWYPPKQPWARGERIRPPGGDNPMGRVKLAFGAGFFLHGTPLPTSIGRATSHGCVRLRNEDALWLARWTLDHGMLSLTDSIIDAESSDPRLTRRHVLERAIPLRIAYQLFEVRGDSLLFWRNVYRKRPLDVAQVLATLGDTLPLDSAALRALVMRSRVKDTAVTRAGVSPR